MPDPRGQVRLRSFGAPEGLRNLVIVGIVQGRDGFLWVGTDDGVYRYDGHRFSRFSVEDGLPSSSVVSLGLAPDGAPCAGGAIGMACWDGARFRPEAGAGLPTGTVHAIASHGDAQWVGTDVGLYVRRGAGSFIPAPGWPGSSATSVDTVWADAHGVAASDGDAVQLGTGDGSWRRIDRSAGLGPERIDSLLRDRDGGLWIRSTRSLWVLQQDQSRPVDGEWQCLPGTEGRVVRSFVLLPSGAVFLGGAPGDLLYIGPDGHATSLGREFERPADHFLRALALGREGDLWIGTKSGLYRLPGAAPGPISRVQMPGTAIDTPVSSLAVAGGRLWVGTTTGVVVNDRGHWSRFDDEHGFHDPAMPYVAARRDGRACVAYGESLGVTCFRYQDGAVSDLQHLGVSDGLTSGRVYFLGEDERERLWVGTGDGVDVVAPDGVEHFAETDGLAGNDSAATAFFRDRDGSLWLGSTSGLTHIDAAHYTGPPAPPATTIVGGTLGDRPLTGAAVMTAPHDRSSLTVEYAAASFVDPARVEYQVRLSPLEESWAATRSRFARYAALPPGSYRLEVRARAGKGPWGAPASIELAVAEAWWQSGWFPALLVVAGVAALAAAFALRQRVVLGRRTRQIQAESNASFRALVDSLPDLVAALRDGEVIYLNRAARNILGFAEGDDSFLGRDIQEWVHPDDRPRTEERAARVAARPTGAISETLEFRVRGPDGAWRTCETTHHQMDFGGAQAVVITGRDVTQQRRMREKVLMADRMVSLGTLAAGVAHEINNPLSYVTGNLEVVADALDRGDAASPGPALDELRQALEEAREGAERVRKIVHGLRAFSRPDRDERPALPVEAVLETAIRLTANEIRHRAALVRELGPVPLVAADDGQLAQVFINLLLNAAHAIPEGAADQHRITVRTRTDELGRALIEIQDTGRGMAPEVRARAFDPFFTTRAVGAGPGLGLSICHGIVSGLGGHIGIESAPGRGTILHVILPAAPAGSDGLLSAQRDR